MNHNSWMTILTVKYLNVNLSNGQRHLEGASLIRYSLWMIINIVIPSLLSSPHYHCHSLCHLLALFSVFFNFIIDYSFFGFVIELSLSFVHWNIYEFHIRFSRNTIYTLVLCLVQSYELDFTFTFSWWTLSCFRIRWSWSWIFLLCIWFDSFNHKNIKKNVKNRQTYNQIKKVYKNKKCLIRSSCTS